MTNDEPTRPGDAFRKHVLGDGSDEALLREALEILDNARCKLHDPTLRVQWGQRKNRLMAKLRERLN